MLDNLNKSTKHRILSNDYRLQIINILENYTEIHIDELISNIEHKNKQNLKIELIHNHIPLLQEHNIIKYDQENKIIYSNI